MGTPDFAVDTLNCLINSKHEVVAVFTQPDKPKGRSKKPAITPVKEAAQKAGIEVYQPAKVKEPEVIRQLKEINPDVIVVVAFGQILTAEILNLPKYGCINVHASLLPKLRGAAPIQWAVINGDKESGVTIQQMDEGIDTGDILLVKKCPLDKKETGGSLFEKLALLGGPMVLEVLDMAEEGRLSPVKQDNEAHTYAKMLNKDMGCIAFNAPAAEIERLARGLNPWPGTFTYLHGKMVKIWDAYVMPEGEMDASVKPGTITSTENGEIVVKTGDGYLVIVSLQPEGKKRMETEAFLRGYKVEKGEQFEERK